MLLDAVRLACTESQGSAASTFAVAFAENPDDVVTMYATFFAEHVPIFGYKRPSSLTDRVVLTSPLKEFAVEEGALVLRERDGHDVYDGLSIRMSPNA